ncbi:SusC/RagA family TonB-linked outer membrane protein [Negadavirga shengliensis]|uniref:SusC/RagA family TonB-linked outer membrane protein n=1 Tax=Negadavirga shengliensis TaxID=1389218 RepID=A0ABV9T5V7_9BACT
MFDNAPITSHNLSLSGSNDEGQYLFSMNYFNQEGTVYNTGLERVTLRANSQYNIGNNVRIGENLGLSYTDNPAVGINNADGPIAMAMRSQPIIPVYDIMGNFAGSFGHQIGPARNPVAMLERTRHNKNTNNRIFGNVFLEADILRDFVFRTSFGGEYNNSSSHSFTFPEYENAENNSINAYTESAGRAYNWTWTNTLAYNKLINNVHQINAVIGSEAYDAHFRTVGGTTQGFFSFDPNYVALPTGSGGRTNTSFRTSESLYSVFGRVDYSYDDKYLAGFTIRRDGSSKFINNRYGWFPAFTAGWRISEENFLSELRWVDDLKIRGGWGIMGNQLNVDPMNAFSTYASDWNNSYYDIRGSNNSIVEGFYRNRMGNPDAAWEKNIQANFGIDLSMWSGSLQLSADYYRKDIQDLLFNPQLAGTAGAATVPYINIASMSNTGLDFTLSGYKQLSNDLQINGSLMVTTYDNTITGVSDNADYFDLEWRRFGDNIVRNQVGRPVGEFFGYQIEGFWNSQAEIDAANEAAQAATGDPGAVYQNDVAVGRFRYADVNGDGRVTADDRTAIGNPNPDFTYGINLGVNFRNFDLSMFFFGSQGNDIWNNLLWWRDFFPAFQGAKSYTALYDSWTPDNMNAKAPIQETTASFSTNNVPNSYFVEDGSYLRLRNAQIGYTVPAELLQRFKIQSLRLYLQGANLFTITNYSGIDPEIGGSAVAFGIDEGTYPTQRQFLVGLNVRF